VVRNMLSVSEHPCRYRLHVAASDLVDLITVAGGWLTDRAMAGWHVTAYIAGDHDDRPLHILGVGAIDCASALDWRDPTALHTLAVMPDLYQRDKQIRARVRRAIATGEVEANVIGDAYPPDLRRVPTTVEHQCSSAAEAFKRQALAAAGGFPGLLADREALFSWQAIRARPADRAPRWPTQGGARQLPVAVSMGGEVLAHGFAESARAGSDEC
jgi:hypothetical protein